MESKALAQAANPMMNPITNPITIPIAKPQIGAEEQAAVMQVLGSGQLAQGAQVAAFEVQFGAWVQAPLAVAVNSGTAALHLALLAHGIGPGDEVITSSFSFIASANAVLYTGATPVFADIEPESFNISAETIEAAITPRTRAIVVVHLFGQACDMAPIAALAERHGLALIEDACQSHGARLHGLPVGSWGTACYSFYPTKNMTTGEGGMVTTADPAIAERVRLLREHGMRKRYVHEIVGFNMRMTNVHAAIGLAQLQKVDGWTQRRRRNAAVLDAGMRDLPGVATPVVRPGATHVYHQYTVRVTDAAQLGASNMGASQMGASQMGVAAARDQLIAALTAHGVGHGIYYPTPIHQQQAFVQMYAEGRLNAATQPPLPHTEAAALQVLSLPVHPGLSDTDLQTIVTAVRVGAAAPALAPAATAFGA